MVRRRFRVHESLKRRNFGILLVLARLVWRFVCGRPARSGCFGEFGRAGLLVTGKRCQCVAEGRGPDGDDVSLFVGLLVSGPFPQLPLGGFGRGCSRCAVR